VNIITNYSPLNGIQQKIESDDNKKHIGLLLSDECSVANAGVIGEAFRIANEIEQAEGAPAPYRFSVLSSHGGSVTSSSSISIWTQKLESYSLVDFHAFFVACHEAGAADALDDQLLSWLCGPGGDAHVRHQHAENLLNNPSSIEPPPVPIFWFRDVPTAAWSISTPPADLALAQIERDLNADIAQKIARVLQPHVVTGAKFDFEDLSAGTTEKIHESARWIRENYSNPISVAQAAEAAAMSTRNYPRRFKSELGVTPSEYLTRTRFEIICRLLVETDLPVDKIARRCGMGNGNRLGRLFRKRFGVSPMIFRVQNRVTTGNPVTPSADIRQTSATATSDGQSQ
jgi:transcriptional regulator GlxA family with amidase domain